MNHDPDRERELVAHYQSQQLPTEKVDAIRHAVEAAQQSDSENKTRRNHGRAWIAIAASIVFLIGTALWLLRSRRQPEVIDEPSDQQIVANGNLETPPAPEAPPAALPRFRFVAIRSHDDNCPHCRSTGEMFAKLERQFRDRPVDFEQLQLQNTAQAAETLRRAEQLQLTELIEGKTETAFGILLSEDETRLIRFVPADGTAINAQRLRDVIDQ